MTSCPIGSVIDRRRKWREIDGQHCIAALDHERLCQADGRQPARCSDPAQGGLDSIVAFGSPNSQFSVIDTENTAMPSGPTTPRRTHCPRFQSSSGMATSSCGRAKKDEIERVPFAASCSALAFDGPSFCVLVVFSISRKGDAVQPVGFQRPSTDSAHGTAGVRAALGVQIHAAGMADGSCLGAVFDLACGADCVGTAQHANAEVGCRDDRSLRHARFVLIKATVVRRGGCRDVQLSGQQHRAGAV